jgi:hypothetical membrane protein
MRISGSLLLCSGLVFFIFNTVAEGIYPNYSVASNALSDLGAIGTNTFFLWNGQLFVSGVLLLLGMYFLFYKSQFRLNIGRANLVGILYMLPAVAAIIVSLFQENSVVGSVGGHNLLHGLGAIIAFVCGGISAVYAYRLTKAPFRYFSIVLGIITLVFVPLFLFSNASISGLTERLVVYPFILWQICFGTYLLSMHSGMSANLPKL